MCTVVVVVVLVTRFAVLSCFSFIFSLLFVLFAVKCCRVKWQCFCFCSPRLVSDCPQLVLSLHLSDEMSRRLSCDITHGVCCVCAHTCPCVCLDNILFNWPLICKRPKRVFSHTGCALCLSHTDKLVLRLELHYHSPSPQSVKRSNCACVHLFSLCHSVRCAFFYTLHLWKWWCFNLSCPFIVVSLSSCAFTDDDPKQLAIDLVRNGFINEVWL